MSPDAWSAHYSRRISGGGRRHLVVWDGCDDAGHSVASGVYWSQLTTGRGFVSSKRMIVLP